MSPSEYRLYFVITLKCYMCREAVVKLQKVCPSVNYNTDPPQYNTREDMPELPMESLLNRL